MTKPIHELLGELPTSSMTTRLLGALDYLVPGEWENITNFEQMIKSVTGEEDQGIIQQVGDRAIRLYADPENGYQRAVSIYQLLDDTGGLAGAVSLANKAGESFEFLGFLEKVTPKADTTQAVDAAVKLVGELAAFCYTNGIPGDSIGDFASSIVNSAKEDRMRLAAFLACDCVLPLGPDFLLRITQFLEGATDDMFGENSRFTKIAEHIPGANIAEKKGIILSTLQSTGEHFTNFVNERGMTRESVFAKVQEYLGAADGKLDYVAAAIDLSTSYFEHTGIQTVCRRVVTRAYGEL